MAFVKIKDYPNYSVNELGQVRSDRKGIILKHRVQKSGYCDLLLYNENGRKLFLVHRLVAEAFLPKEVGKNVVNHKDGNKENNNVLNLAWVTTLENNLHAIDTGLNNRFKGTNNPQSRLSETEAAELQRLILEGELSPTEIAKQFGVTTSAVYYYRKIKRKPTYV